MNYLEETKELTEQEWRRIKAVLQGRGMMYTPTRWERFREWLYERIAWLLPRRLAYWATVRVWASATDREVTAETDTITVVEVLDRWQA